MEERRLCGRDEVCPKPQRLTLQIARVFSTLARSYLFYCFVPCTSTSLSSIADVLLAGHFVISDVIGVVSIMRLRDKAPQSSIGVCQCLETLSV